MKLPDIDKEKLTMLRLINGWLALSLVAATTVAVVEAIKFIGRLF